MRVYMDLPFLLCNVGLLAASSKIQGLLSLSYTRSTEGFLSWKIWR